MSTATLRLPMTRRLVLDRPGACWLIETGSLDLFAADLVGDVAQSSLEYVGSLQTGAVMLGLTEVRQDDLRTTLVAQPGPATVLRELLLERGDDGGTLPAADLVDAQQIDAWVIAISGFCAPGRPPAHSVQVEPGAVLDAGSEVMTLIGNREVVWVHGGAAPVQFYGHVSGLSAGVPAPVCRALWLEVGPGETIACRSTGEWLETARANGNVLRDLQPFHQAMLQQLRERRSAEEAMERTQFQTKVQRDGQVFGSALRGLLAPLAATRQADNNKPATSGNFRFEAALASCRAVGHAMGIPIVAPKQQAEEESGSAAVLRIFGASNVRYRRVLLRQDWWKSDQGPMIGFRLNGESAVAFLPQGSSKYMMLDPVAQTRTRVNDDLSAGLDACAYVLYRSFPNRRLTPMDLFTFGLRNGRKDLAIILSVSAMTGLLALALPVATGVLFDQIIPEGQRGNLIQLSIILLSASVAIFLMSLGQSFATQRLEGRMESEMEAALWDRLLNMRTGFFRQFTTGDLASRSLAINEIRQILTGRAVSALLSGVFSVFSLALLFTYSPALAVLASGLILMAIAVSAVSTWISIRLQRKILAVEGSIAGRITELLQGVAKFRVAGAEPTAFARWAEGYTLQKQTRIMAARVAIGMGIFDTIFPAATTIAIYLSAANMLKADPEFSVGHFLAFNAAFGQFLGSTLGFAGAILSVIGIVPVYERARPILDELPELKPDLLDPGALEGAIEMSHVSFRYAKEGPLILNDISLSIKAGQFIALVGESGCGKSTIMRLLLGFEIPETGSISYDGRDLAELDMQAIRRQIGVVLQSGKLLAADVYTNIIGASTLSIDVAWEAAKRAGVDDDIRAMPMGMHTVISEGGGGISGGQRQRLLIARAIVHRPRILFFDEATSALDNQTQAIVSSSLDAMQSTRIVIAHRLSTIVQADQILVFKEGRLHESGSYTELLASGGYFAELASRQLA